MIYGKGGCMEKGTILHASSMSQIYVDSDNTIFKYPGSQIKSKLLLARESAVMDSLNKTGCNQFPTLLSSYNDELNYIKMTKMGTHNLKDMMHDISSSTILCLIPELVLCTNQLHFRGFVHRDIKPGNFMINVSNKDGIMGFAGLIDFGLSLRINKKQDEPTSIGGTRPYSHISQTSRKYSNERAHPGQDWFSLGRTIAHLLIGGSNDSFAALIDSGKASPLATETYKKICNHHKSKIQNSILELIEFVFTQDSNSLEALPRLEMLGKKCAESINEIIPQNFKKEKLDFQKAASGRPKRHDILIIVDSTESMKEEIDDLKENLDSVSLDLSKKLDLRIDLWGLRDYSRTKDFEDPIQIIGKRMRYQALSIALENLKSNSTQHDDAEAYELALQEAYLTERWTPRQESTRTIILIGDSYPHGWLRKNFWAEFMRNKKLNSKNIPNEFERRYEIFERHHPDINMPWKWQQREEENARKFAAKNRNELDEFSQRHSLIPTKKGKRYRPNIVKSIERCISEKNANVHCVLIGESLVARNFMKFGALIGEGTFTQADHGELKMALNGLFSIPDPELFNEIKEEIESENPDTEILGSITSFITD